MLSRDDELLLKKRLLRVRSERLRQALGEQFMHRAGPSLGVLEHIVTTAQWLRHHPAWVIGPLAAALIWRRKAAKRGLVAALSLWASRGMWAWHTWQRIQPVVGMVRAMQLSQQDAHRRP